MTEKIPREEVKCIALKLHRTEQNSALYSYKFSTEFAFWNEADVEADRQRCHLSVLYCTFCLHFTTRKRKLKICTVLEFVQYNAL